MATQSKKRKNQNSPDKKSLRRFLKPALFALAALLILGAVAAAGWREVNRYRQHRMLERGRLLIEAKDLRQAEVAVGRALQINPGDPAATRMMIQLAETQGLKVALYWHKALTTLEPDVIENHLAWARAALRFNEPAIAEQALHGISDAGKKTAVYKDIEGQIAQTLKQTEKAESCFSEAVKIEPNNEEYQLHLAALRLSSADEAVRASAQPIVERIATNPRFFRSALQALLSSALEAKDWDKALSLAKQLQGAPGAPFEDRMLYLALLRRFQRPEFYGYLSEVQEISTSSPMDVGALISWLGSNGLVLIAVDWAKRLPEPLKSKYPIPAAIGECYAIQLDWDTLKDLVTDTNWEQADFIRSAFLARVQRQEGDKLASANSWNTAVRASMNRPEFLIMLARYATAWGWEEETRDLLWVVARGSTNPQWALNSLFQYYLSKHDSGGLLSVSNRMLELDPQSSLAQNNVVLLSLLRSTNMDKSISLAAAAYKKDPTNPGLASTYAYALYLQGKTEEGLKIMRALDESKLNDPSYAVYFGLLLLDSGAADEAKKYLEIAKGGKLLPEEEELVKKKLEKLQQRGG